MSRWISPGHFFCDLVECDTEGCFRGVSRASGAAPVLPLHEDGEAGKV